MGESIFLIESNRPTLNNVGKLVEMVYNTGDGKRLILLSNRILQQLHRKVFCWRRLSNLLLSLDIKYNLKGNLNMANTNAKPISESIRARLKGEGVRFWANDNIANYVSDDEKTALIDELTEKFEGVLDSLLIDRDTDPNSMGTAKRLAKMYINETMAGRYTQPPAVTAFPNDNVDTRYSGMIVVRAELLSMCSHHHQAVKGVAYIGVLPSTKVIGLSKYARIAQHCARRGTLQEELTMMIADQIVHHTGAKDVAVYVQATHGCMENRGVCAHSSLTQTTELRGQFFSQSVKQEFLDYIKMQQQFAGNRT